MTPSAAPRVLIAGAGFVGCALARELAARGAAVRLVARRADPRADPPVLAADLADPSARARALDGVDVAVWLVHSLDAADYERRDPALAAAFAADAARRGLARLVYLGALAGPADRPDSSDLSTRTDDARGHAASRHATGRALAAAGVPTVELRASVVVGRGSAVIEMVRALVLRLPVLLIPAGADALTQPVALRDAVHALADAALGPPRPGVWDLAGDDRVPWRDFMVEGAALLGRARPRLTMPIATPRLSGLTLGALTPLTRAMGEALVRGLGRPALAAAPERRWPAPPGGWTPFRHALALALQSPAP